MTVPFQTPDRLGDIAGAYDALFCDVWGVLHNGVEAFVPAWKALREARGAGAAVVLITNAPRPFHVVREMLDRLGVAREAYDAIVTSGDVTRELIAAAEMPVFHLGPERDRPLFKGLDVRFAEPAEARTVVATGLFDDDTETPDDYAPLLRQFAQQDRPLICANPDIVVERGDRLIFCAGALARAYEEMGGRTMISGKPYAPIYESALQAAGERAGGRVPRPDRVLAIGDALATDMRGALDRGFDFLYIADGIHSREYGPPHGSGSGTLRAWLAEKGAAPNFVMTSLA